MKRKTLIFVAVAASVLVFTNPKPSDFNDFSRIKNSFFVQDGMGKVITGRTSYWLIFSIYEYDIYWDVKFLGKTKYIGLMKNFYLWKQEIPVTK